MNGKVTWKWLAIVLAGLCVGMLGWFANGVWSAQEATETLNTTQQLDIGGLKNDIKTISDRITSIDKSVLDLENLMKDRRDEDWQRDSVLQNIAWKVDIMFRGR